MSAVRVSEANGPVVIAYAGFAPLVLAATLASARDVVPQATVVLGLVLVIVCAAATGLRWAGWAATVSGALWFNWFHTTPYGSFAIDGAQDVQVDLLLLAVGGAVTELALWGARWQARAAGEEARLGALLRSAEDVAAHADPDTVVRLVESQLTDLLGLDRATWVAGALPPGSPVLHRDGRVVRAGSPLDVAHDGLPTDAAVSLPVTSSGDVVGRIDLVASSHVARPGVEALRIASLLADQVSGARASRSRQDERNGGPSRPRSAGGPSSRP